MSTHQLLNIVLVTHQLLNIVLVTGSSEIPSKNLQLFRMCLVVCSAKFSQLSIDSNLHLEICWEPHVSTTRNCLHQSTVREKVFLCWYSCEAGGACVGAGACSAGGGGTPRPGSPLEAC